MATVKITNADLDRFRAQAQTFINRNPERTPLHYALEKTIKKTARQSEEYADGLEEIRIDCALKDKDSKQFVYREDKGFGGQINKVIEIDPEKAKDFTKRSRYLANKEIEIEAHKASEVPKTLEAVWVQAFVGIVMDDPMETGKPQMIETETKVKELKPEMV